MTRLAKVEEEVEAKNEEEERQAQEQERKAKRYRRICFCGVRSCGIGAFTNVSAKLS